MYKPLETTAFLEKSLSFISHDVKKMEPHQVVETLRFYGKDERRQTFLREVLEKLRNRELDIKSWKAREFCALVKEIATLEPS
jgi:hypothetical protein